MPTILSTKKLSLSQQSLLLNSGIGYVEYDAIKINLKNIPSNSTLEDNLIFTSKNAVKAVVNSIDIAELERKNIFCVGKKTAEFIINTGLPVLACESYGADLAEKLISNHKSWSFTYFCGNLRRDELPNLLSQNGINFEEVEVYSTSLNKKKFDQEFDGILFYSPSGVESFCSDNELRGSTAFCIGETTASEAKKHTGNIRIANKPSIENLIVQVIKYFK